MEKCEKRSIFSIQLSNLSNSEKELEEENIDCLNAHCRSAPQFLMQFDPLPLSYAGTLYLFLLVNILKNSLRDNLCKANQMEKNLIITELDLVDVINKTKTK